MTELPNKTEQGVAPKATDAVAGTAPEAARRPRATTKLLWAVNLVIFYALSPLPMGVLLDLMPYRAAASAYVVLEPAYAPLIWLSNQNRNVKEFYAWYESLLDA